MYAMQAICQFFFLTAMHGVLTHRCDRIRPRWALHAALCLFRVLIEVMQKVMTNSNFAANKFDSLAVVARGLTAAFGWMRQNVCASSSGEWAAKCVRPNV